MVASCIARDGKSVRTVCNVTDKTFLTAGREAVLVDGEVGSWIGSVAVYAVLLIAFHDGILDNGLQEVSVAVENNLCNMVVAVAVVAWAISTCKLYEIETGLEILDGL